MTSSRNGFLCLEFAKGPPRWHYGPMKPYLLKSEEIERLPGMAKTHFLNPNAIRVNKSLGDATGLTGLGVHLISVAPGHDTTEHHVHYFEDEAVYILSGTGEARLGEERFAVGPGDFLGYRKGGLAHSLKNTGAEPLTCLVMGQRLAHDVADYPDLGKRLFRNAGQSWDLVDRADIQTPPPGTGMKVAKPGSPS